MFATAIKKCLKKTDETDGSNLSLQTGSRHDADGLHGGQSEKWLTIPF
ncbi:MAG: hypothetical protein H7833_04390 [Magnetococcus sp. DMHC-1]